MNQALQTLTPHTDLAPRSDEFLVIIKQNAAARFYSAESLGRNQSFKPLLPLSQNIVDAEFEEVPETTATLVPSPKNYPDLPSGSHRVNWYL